MILIDTSVWIPFFSNTASPAADFIENTLRHREIVCINAVVEMEILQGIRDDSQFKTIKTYLADFQYFPHLGKQYFDLSVEIFRNCRKRGMTIRRSLDCLIASNAIIDGLQIAHLDRDFEMIKKVYPKLNTIRLV